MSQNNRRVVITGIGVLSPYGIDVDNTWDQVINGKSCIKLISNFDTGNFPVKIAGEILGLNVLDYLSKQEEHIFDIFVQYGLVAAELAIRDSRLMLASENKHRIGVVIGSGIGGVSTITNNYDKLVNKGVNRVSPFFIPGGIINMLPGQISIKYGLKGPNYAVSSACSSSSHAIGLAYKQIKYDEVDLMVAGGAEKGILPLSVAAFHACRTLSKCNSQPEKASRPWDQARDGFVMSEGAAIIVLEEYEHAKKREANIYAELVGVGMSSDSYHITSPDPDGEGVYQAMNNAILEAKINADMIGYINAHATSTVTGDPIELKGIGKLFKNDLKNIAVSSTKSMTGHLLGAAGSIEAIFTILALKNGILPPTINLDNPIVEALNINLVPHVAQNKKITYALSNSLGFGGTNCCLAFKRI